MRMSGDGIATVRSRVRGRGSNVHTSLLLAASLALWGGAACVDNSSSEKSGAGGASSGGTGSGGSDAIAGAASSASATSGFGGGSFGGNVAAAAGATAAGGTHGGSSTASGGSTAGRGQGSGGADDSTSCTRERLKSNVDTYFEALAAHDASTLPLANSVKFTENGKSAMIGSEGLWKTAGPVKYAHSALDTEACSSVSQAVVPDGSMDVPVAVRLKLQGAELSEIETIVVRPGDYKVSGQSFASNTAALIASGASVKWEEPVPAAERNTREEIAGWMDRYYRLFPGGVCNTAASCKRIENGGGSFNCSAGASCDPSPPTSQAALNPRLILVDVEAGLGVGFTMFMGNTDTHLFKMYGGQVYGVSAILGAAPSSGWD
jgi:hypothetical protein